MSGVRDLSAIATAVHAAIHDVAPDVDIAAIDPDNWLHEEAGLDSLDFLRLVELIGRDLGPVITPGDYLLCATLRSLIAYVAQRVDDAAFT